MSSSLNPRVLLRGLLLIVSLALLGYLLEQARTLIGFDKAWVDNAVRGKGLSGELLFIAAGALFTAAGLPRQLACFLGGYAFGFGMGALLGLLASVGGCIAAFCYARLFGRALLAGPLARRIKALDEFMHDNTLQMTLLIRLLPVGSNLLANLTAGVANVRALPFFTGSALGYVPQTLVFALLGSGIHLDPTLRISLAALLFIASAALGVSLYRKYRHGKHLDEETERELDATPE